MAAGGTEALLRAIRRLRLGRLEPQDADEPLRGWLASIGLGAVCERLAGCVSASVSDPRKVEAVYRYFGLVRLPEGLEAIAASFGPAARDGQGRPRLSTRQIQHLIRAALDDVRGPVDCTDPPHRGMHSRWPRWDDPFPTLQGQPRALSFVSTAAES